MAQINAFHWNISLHFHYASPHPSPQSAGLKSYRDLLSVFLILLTWIFFIVILLWKGVQVCLSSLLKTHCIVWDEYIGKLVLTLLYFTILALSSFKFLGCLLSPRVNKLEGRKGVIFLQPAYRVLALASLEWNLMFKNAVSEASTGSGCGIRF